MVARRSSLVLIVLLERAPFELGIETFEHLFEERQLELFAVVASEVVELFANAS